MKQTFLLRNEAIRNNAIDAILSLPIDDKSPHEVHVKEPKRSKAQNDRMWPMLNDVSRQVLWHGQRLAPEDWKDLFTALWLKTKNWSNEVCLVSTVALSCLACVPAKCGRPA
ncbi:protein ninB [Escherichia coli DEC11C]|nr:protein ninB [Escherichia coli DEC11C]